jgi:hypothetical protein
MWQQNRNIFKMMVQALNNLPITATLLKKSKIGKGVNQILKNQIFDNKTNEEASSLVNRWKKLVKEYKQHEGDHKDE